MNAKKRILAIVSALLSAATLLSCVGCSAIDDENSESSTNFYSESATETETEATLKKTEKQTQKQTQKQTATTAKKTETQLVPGVSKTDIKLNKRSYNFANMSTTEQMYFKFLSRAKVSKDGLIFDNSCATLEFQGYFTGDVIVEINSKKNAYYGNSYFTVYVDGVRSNTRFEVEAGKTTKLTIANFTGNYYHTIKIVKQTEFKWSLATIKSLEFTGYLSIPPQEKEYYIEFLGDSLTTAYGNIGTPSVDSDISDSPDYQDGTKSYAYLFAEAVNADYSIVARSAAGISQCWSNSPIIDYYKKHSKDRSSDAYDTANARKPDLIVLHLGANDYNVGGSNSSNFVSKGKELVNYFRGLYGEDVPIIWAYDPNEGFPSKVKEIMNSFGGEAEGYYTLSLGWSERGAGGHPSAKEHENHAKILLDFVTSKNILK